MALPQCEWNEERRNLSCNFGHSTPRAPGVSFCFLPARGMVMTEYEIVSLLREHVAFMVSVLQWWVGITLGILVAVHVVGEELNGFIVSILIVLYAAFTAMLSGILASHSERASRSDSGRFAHSQRAGNGSKSDSDDDSRPTGRRSASTGCYAWHNLLLGFVSFNNRLRHPSLHKDKTGLMVCVDQLNPHLKAAGWAMLW
jgi:hypothetical protein